MPTNVNVTWSGRRSDTGCPAQTNWADQGFYHVFAAALGSTPTDVQFEVTRAPTKTVTKTAKPKPEHQGQPVDLVEREAVGQAAARRSRARSRSAAATTPPDSC